MATRNQPKKNGRPKKPARSKKPLGVLPVPPEIEKQVRDWINPIASEKAIRRQILEDTLSFYYGGDIVLMRMDENEVEVLAAGDDVGPAVRSLTPEQRQIYGTAWPIPLGAVII